VEGRDKPGPDARRAPEQKKPLMRIRMRGFLIPFCLPRPFPSLARTGLPQTNIPKMPERIAKHTTVAETMPMSDVPQ